MLCLYLCFLKGLTLAKKAVGVCFNPYTETAFRLLFFLFLFFYEKKNGNGNYFLFILPNGHTFMNWKEKFRKIEIRRN